MKTVIAKRWAIARELAAQGMTCAQISEATGQQQGTTRAWAKREGIQLQAAHRGPRRAPSARIEAMGNAFRSGMTLAEIGEEHGISRERVRALIARIGLVGKDGGQAARIRNNGGTCAEKVREAAHDRIVSRWGVEYELAKELRADGTIRAFESQRGAAKRRAIPWNLTFAEWYAIWQESGNLHLRGRGKGHFCMARRGDSGAYEPGNVVIQLATDNSRDAVDKWRGKTKEHKGVFCLYPGRDRAWLAVAGKCRLGYFTSAEDAAAARLAHLEAA